MNIQQHIQNTSAPLAECLQKIPARRQKNQILFTESLTRLAYGLYVFGNEALCAELIDRLTQVRFAGDYNYWSWIEYALALKASMAHAAGDTDQAAQAIDRITAPLDIGSELEITVKKRVFARMLAGEMLSEDGLRDTAEINDPAAEYNDRLLNLMEMVKISAIKTNAEEHNPALEVEISRQIARCRQLINLIGLENTQPFKG
ncbi:DUF6707 family protein [Affinibrenneria salicis]|nr:DUF6707 family protein [Affinibrenneria salicis]